MRTAISHNPEKTITYVCKSKTPADAKEYVRCAQVPSEVDDDCTVQIWFRHVEGPKPKLGGETDQVENKVNVAVGKTDHSMSKVIVNLQIKKMKQEVLIKKTKSFDDWRDYCYFRALTFTSSSTDTIFEIVVAITWTLSELSDCYFQISDFCMNEFLSDVTIVIGKEKLFAHKLILCGASPVMLAMLTTPMKEATENRIVIKDVEIDVMKAILKLLYTGKDGKFEDIEIALKGLIFAEQYDMKKVKELCERKLLENLKVDNALKILDVADTHQSEMLIKECMEFIVEHKKEIIQTEYFEEMYTRKPLLMMRFTVNVIDDIK